MAKPTKGIGRVGLANLKPYIEVLGTDDAMRFFLYLGGSQIYLGLSRSQGGLAESVVGSDKAVALAKVLS
ncbi:MAG: hypothetical protein J0I64_03555, partial [Devosia sp.]|nr:hypothetical protein [Devosia sp.]